MSNIAGSDAPYGHIVHSSAEPSLAGATSWPFYEPSHGMRHLSWSAAMESTTESTSDGMSDNYTISHRPSVASSSNDPRDPAFLDDPSTASIVNAKRPRGRPRKHPVVVPDVNTKPVKSRSKTGCLTCRSRKKKCDEAKPVCMNCQKNNVVCQGYPSPEVWQGGKQKLPERSRSSTPCGTAQLHSGQLDTSSTTSAPQTTVMAVMETDLDQILMEHYKRTTSRVLTLYSHVGQNPFLDIILPMAAVRPGLMHAVLSLAGTHICTQSADARVHDRQAYHLGRALRDLSTDSQLARGAVDDGIIAQSLILLLRSIVAGEHNGEYRVHMNAGRHLITSQRYADPDFHRFLVESCIYHEFIKSLTSLERQSDSLVIRDFGLPDPRGMPTNTAYLADFDNLFPYFTSITALRDRVRITRRGHQGNHQRDIREAQRIETALRGWTSVEASGSSRFKASQLFWKCAALYLRRTMTASIPSDALHAVVEEGLRLLFRLGPNSSMQAILTMPIFLLGCATFDRRQRAHIVRAFDIHFAYKQCGSILHVRRVVCEVWTLMDEQDELSWDWETVIVKMGLDFLVT